MLETEKGKAEVSKFTIDLAIRIALIAGVVYVSLLLLRPVAPLILWAIILAVAVFPLFRVMRRRLHLRSGLTAAVLSLLLLVLLLTPVIVLAGSAIETLNAYAQMLLRGDHVVPPPPESVRSWPLGGRADLRFLASRLSRYSDPAGLSCRRDRLAGPLGRPDRRRGGLRGAAVCRRDHRGRRPARLCREARGNSGRAGRPYRRCAGPALCRDHRLDHSECVTGGDWRRPAAISPAGHRHAAGRRPLCRRHHLRLPRAGDRPGRPQHHHDPRDHLGMVRAAGAGWLCCSPPTRCRCFCSTTCSVPSSWREVCRRPWPSFWRA